MHSLPARSTNVSSDERILRLAAFEAFGSTEAAPAAAPAPSGLDAAARARDSMWMRNMVCERLERRFASVLAIFLFSSLRSRRAINSLGLRTNS